MVKKYNKRTQALLDRAHEDLKNATKQDWVICMAEIGLDMVQRSAILDLDILSQQLTHMELKTEWARTTTEVGKTLYFLSLLKGIQEKVYWIAEFKETAAQWAIYLFNHGSVHPMVLDMVSSVLQDNYIQFGE